MAARDIAIGLLFGDGKDGYDNKEIWDDFLEKKTPIPYSGRYNGVIGEHYTYEIGVYSPIINDLPYTMGRIPEIYTTTNVDFAYNTSYIGWNRQVLYKGIRRGTVSTGYSYAYVQYPHQSSSILVLGYILVYKDGEPIYANFPKRITDPSFNQMQMKAFFTDIGGGEEEFEQAAYIDRSYVCKNIVLPNNITYLVPATDANNGHFLGTFFIDSKNYSGQTVSITNNCDIVYDTTYYRLDGDTIEEAELVVQSKTENITRSMNMAGSYLITKGTSTINFLSPLSFNDMEREFDNVMTEASQAFNVPPASTWENPTFTPTIFKPSEWEV